MSRLRPNEHRRGYGAPAGEEPLDWGHEDARARAEAMFAGHIVLVTCDCRAYLRDVIDAEDAVQQTFLSAWQALRRGNVPRNEAAWLATIARNECVHRIDARGRAPLPALEIDRRPHHGDVHAQAVANKLSSQLEREIRRLPGLQREAMFLREYAGLSYAEVADELGVTRSAIHALLVRARTRVRQRAASGGAMAVAARESG